MPHAHPSGFPLPAFAQANPRGGQHAAATPVGQDRLILTGL